MREIEKPLIILMADDDPDDCLLVQDAFLENGIRYQFRSVEDGEALLEYLRQKGKFSATVQSPRPDLILLDLNMPRKDGREALKEIKTDEFLRVIPVIIFTTSRESEDIAQCYRMGANAFITKPSSFDELAAKLKSINQHWFHTVELPPKE